MTHEQFDECEKINREIASLLNSKREFEDYTRFYTPPGLREDFQFINEHIERVEKELKKLFNECIDSRIDELRKRFEKI